MTLARRRSSRRHVSYAIDPLSDMDDEPKAIEDGEHENVNADLPKKSSRKREHHSDDSDLDEYRAPESDSPSDSESGSSDDVASNHEEDSNAVSEPDDDEEILPPLISDNQLQSNNHVSEASDLDDLKKLFGEFIDASLAALTKSFNLPKPAKRGRRKAGDGQEANSEQLTAALSLAPVEDKFMCPYPKCDKVFKAQPSIKYHLQNFDHDVSDLFDEAIYGDSRDSFQVPNGIELPATLSVLIHKFLPLSEKEYFISESSPLYYHWPPLNRCFEGTIKVLLDKNQPIGTNGNIENIPPSASRKSATKVQTKRAKKMLVMGPEPQSFSPVYQESGAILTHFKTEPNGIQALNEQSSREYLPYNLPIENICFKQVGGELIDKKLAFGDAAAIAKAGRKGFIFQTGFSVNTMDWCPNLPHEHDHVLAIAGSKDSTIFHKIHESVSYKNCIQIWTIASDSIRDESIVSDLLHLPQLSFTILHEHGTIWDMKWLPGSFVKADASSRSSCEESGRLGLLVCAFSDGFIAMYAIPSLPAVRSRFGNETCHLKLDPILQFTGESVVRTLDIARYGDHFLIAGGCMDGDILIWNTSTADNLSWFPMKRIFVHDSLITSIAWKEGDLRYLATSSYDGRISVTDVVSEQVVNTIQRIRGFPSNVSWKSLYEGIIFTGQANTVFWSENENLGRSRASILHSNLVTALEFSPFHDFIASACFNGSLYITNIFKNTIRGQHNTQVPIYQTYLNFSDSDEPVMMFDDAQKPFNAVYTKTNTNSSIYKPVPTAIISARWHPSRNASTWLASGLRCGLVRIESVAISNK